MSTVSKSFSKVLEEAMANSPVPLPIPKKDILANVEILVDDVGCSTQAGICRFKKGDTGVLLSNDFYKYDCKVYLHRTNQVVYFQNEEIQEKELEG